MSEQSLRGQESMTAQWEKEISERARELALRFADSSDDEANIRAAAYVDLRWAFSRGREQGLEEAAKEVDRLIENISGFKDKAIRALKGEGA